MDVGEHVREQIGLLSPLSELDSSNFYIRNRNDFTKSCFREAMFTSVCKELALLVKMMSEY